HVVGQVLPCPRYALDLCLAAELAFRTHFARDSCHLVGEGAQLIDHRVDRVLQLEDLTLDVHGDLLRQVAFRDRGRHLRDVAYLAGQVPGHEVHAVGQVLPRTGDAFNFGLTAELAFG